MVSYLFGLFRVFENDKEVEDFLTENVREGKFRPCIISVKESSQNRWEAR